MSEFLFGQIAETDLQKCITSILEKSAFLQSAFAQIGLLAKITD